MQVAEHEFGAGAPDNHRDACIATSAARASALSICRQSDPYIALPQRFAGEPGMLDPRH